MMTRKAPFVFAIAVVLMTQTAGALDLDVPVGGDIQKAIDEVSSAGGGSVSLAAGVHRIDAAIRMRSNVKLRGKGSDVTTIKTSKVIKSIVQASEGLRNVTIQDLGITGVAVHGSHAIHLVSYKKDHRNIKLSGVHASQTGWGVHIKGADGVVITNCAFTRNGAKGKEGYAHNLYLRRCKNALVSNTKLNGSTSGNGCNISYSRNVTLDKCEVLDNRFRGVRAADTDGYTVTNSTIGRNGRVGLLANREKTPTKNIRFENNVVFENGAEGIQARKGVTGSVTGCRSFNNKGADFDLNSSIRQKDNSTVVVPVAPRKAPDADRRQPSLAVPRGRASVSPELRDGATGGFAHPGISHSQAELEFVKSMVEANRQPWREAWEKLQSSSYASLSWKPRPIANVERGAYNRPDIGGTHFMRDGTAAYTHTLLWAFTNKEAHAAKAAEILNAWSSTLESVRNHDARLLGGMGGIHYCNAAELLKHTWNGWPKEDQDAFGAMLRGVLYPVIKDFYPTANGNWDASMIQTMMAMGIHLDDGAMFRRGVEYFLKGAGNGAVNHYLKPSGQCQESGRDQSHTQMGLEYLLNSCEIAWKQGVDLYGAHGNRLAKGFEYTAKYNLGGDVPFERYESYRGRYKHSKIADKGRGRLRPMYEKAYNHYHNRMKMDMPWCKKAIEKTRPECGGSSSVPWSTLMYANQPAGLAMRQTREKSAD